MKKTQKNNLIKKCPICGSDNISFQLMQKEVPGGKINGLFIGPVLFKEHRKVDDVTYALCNDCGNSWVHQNKNEEIRKKKQRRNLIIGIVFIVAYLLSFVLYYLFT